MKPPVDSPVAYPPEVVFPPAASKLEEIAARLELNCIAYQQEIGNGPQPCQTCAEFAEDLRRFGVWLRLTGRKT